MKFNKYCVPMVLFCVLLANEVKQTDSGDIGKDTLLETIALVGKIVGFTVSGPVAPFMSVAFSMLQMTAKILTSDNSPGKENLSKKDFLESQSKIADAVIKVDNHLSKAVEKLKDVIESCGILEDMRNDMDTLRDAYAKNMKFILDRSVTGKTKQTRMQAMLDYFSSFRKTLRSFVSKYIQPRSVESATGPVNLFFDIILRKDRIAADDGDDCHLESTHTKLFKSYISILKTLTDAYVMVVFAHSMRYRNALRKGDEKYAIETQNIGLDLLNEYKIDMKALMGKAKWALDRASREIRNCGTFELKRGETFDSISFAHILPKFNDWATDKERPQYNKYIPREACFSREEDVNYSEYKYVGECTDGGFRRPADLKVFINSTTPDWPYLYLKIESSRRWGWGTDIKFLGHTKTGPGIDSRKFFVTDKCDTVFCPAYKIRSVAISTQIVRAKPGNVITGVRFGVRDYVIYIDIQQGTFLDDMTVDPKTVTWTETPKSNDVIYLSDKIRKLELGDVELKDNQYLTAIQLKLKNEADGIIELSVGGGNSSNLTASDLTGTSYLEKSNELVLSGCDNPEQFGSDVKNMVSKPPVPFKPYYISFQPSDFEKDFGASTIPYLDKREVYSNRPAPLAGLGIYHLNVEGSGGYISLKLLSTSLSRFIDYKFIEAIDTTIEA